MTEPPRGPDVSPFGVNRPSARRRTSWLLGEPLLPESIQGRFLRLLYFLTVYLIVIQILLLVVFGSVGRLVLFALPALGAPDLLTDVLSGAILLAGLIWLLVALVVGLRWVAAPPAPGAAAPQALIGFDIRKLPSTALRYLRDSLQVVRSSRRRPTDD